MAHLRGVRDLLEFSFESLVAPDMPDAALVRLSRQAATNNARMGLTGRLVCADGRFVQTLEGPAAVLLPLAGLILADRRHRSIRVTAFGGTAERRFHDWSAAGLESSAPAAAGATVVLLPAGTERRRAITASSIHVLAGRGQRSALPDA